MLLLLFVVRLNVAKVSQSANRLCALRYYLRSFFFELTRPPSLCLDFKSAHSNILCAPHPDSALSLSLSHTHKETQTNQPDIFINNYTLKQCWTAMIKLYNNKKIVAFVLFLSAAVANHTTYYLFLFFRRFLQLLASQYI